MVCLPESGLSRSHSRAANSDEVGKQMVGGGLGLSLLKEIAELHGGVVSVTSAPGAGSCFTVVI